MYEGMKDGWSGLPWVFGVVLAVLLAIGILIGMGLKAAFADDDPPSTDLYVCSGTLPATSLRDNHDAPCYPYTVSSTDADHPGYLGHNNDDTFRHVYHEGGDPACIFTGTYHRATGHSVFHVTEQGGGRECSAGTPDGQCAYIAEGWAIFAVTGGSCSQHGIPICTGTLCI